MIIAGRGFGKTRTGAEQVRVWAQDYPLVNLIGATADDARDIMIEGESGILAICPDDERPKYLPSKRRLEWPSGAKSLIFTADEPERLRGKQHMKLWADELGAWRYAEAWDQAMFGLRLGDNPQCIVTTTPKPRRIIRDLVADPDAVIVRGSTYENRDNLAPAFLSKIVKKYEGTTLGRQELHGEILTDIPGALWQRHRIIHAEAPEEIRRIVVAIDPAVTNTEDSDDTGIIVAGTEADQFYVLEDLSGRYTPEGWARQAVAAYHRWEADRIVGEVNNGGDMIESVLRQVDKNISYTSVRASRGKAVRAEPIAALYEQGRGYHCGSFDALEDQMCSWTTEADWSPDRMDAMVWAATELMLEPEISTDVWAVEF